MTDQPQSQTQPLTEDKTEVLGHIIELRQRLIGCVAALAAVTGVCYHYNDLILSWLIAPLAQSMGQEGTQRLIYTSLTEAFVTSLKLSFLSALFITLPVIISQIWMFIAPGLYKTERKAFLPFLIATPLLFAAGALLVYFYIMPMAWHFFLSFQTTAGQTILPIQLEARIGDYLNLIIMLIFAFGLCFQLPVLLMLLARAGIIDADSLARKRKYMLILAFVIGAVLTPPDILSQTLLAVPLYVLYEISIFLIRRFEKAKERES
ncbi:MAG: twin-arginine translocase subunit TatC [Alphaproteobacteria bacterium]|nr:twin-arginine translocase subunit TatC [Alphaproteobacteria bacterium]